MAVDAADRVAIAYSSSDTSIWYAAQVTAGGNCGPGNTWACSLFVPYYYNPFGRQWASLAVDSSGKHHLSWGNKTDVMYGVEVGPGGNCGPGNTWNCVAAAPAYAPYVSLTLDAADRPYIGFVDARVDTTAGVALPGAGGDWQVLGALRYGNTGRFNSVAVDRQGRTHIASYDDEAANLSYAVEVGSGGNCGGGAWSCQVIDTWGPLYYWWPHPTRAGVSLALDPNDVPHISYGGSGLRYAHPVAAGGNCGPANSWLCEIVRDNVFNAGNTVIRLDRQGRPHIAYVHRIFVCGIGFHCTYLTNIGYAMRAGAGGNCGPNNAWGCNEWPAYQYPPDRIDMALDGQDRPYLAFGSPGLIFSASSFPSPATVGRAASLTAKSSPPAQPSR